MPVVLCLFDEALSICEETCVFESQRLDISVSFMCDSISSEICINTLSTDQVVALPNKARSLVSETVETTSNQEMIDVNDTDWFFEGSNDLEVKLDATARQFISSNECLATVEKSVYDAFGLTEMQSYVNSDMKPKNSTGLAITPQACLISTLKEDTFVSSNYSSTAVTTEDRCHEVDDDFSFEELPQHDCIMTSTAAEHLCRVEMCRTELKQVVTADSNHLFKTKTANCSSRLSSLLNSRKLLSKPLKRIIKGSRHITRHDAKHLDQDSAPVVKAGSREQHLSAEIKSNVCFPGGLQCNNKDKTVIVDSWMALKQLWYKSTTM